MPYGWFVVNMGKAKDLIVKPIRNNIAKDFVRKYHYSGKVVPNSQLHLGVFLYNQLQGVMQFGPSINKKGTKNLVKETNFNDFIELNRMAFNEVLPKNSESRALSIAFKLIKKYKPNIKWVISFADGTQCGSGTIYRASGFKLVGITKNAGICELNGKITHIKKTYDLGLTTSFMKKSDIPKLKKKGINVKLLVGYQIKYIYFLDKTKIRDLTVPIIPFSELDKLQFPEGVRHKEHLKHNA